MLYSLSFILIALFRFHFLIWVIWFFYYLFFVLLGVILIHHYCTVSFQYVPFFHLPISITFLFSVQFPLFFCFSFFFLSLTWKFLINIYHDLICQTLFSISTSFIYFTFLLVTVPCFFILCSCYFSFFYYVFLPRLHICLNIIYSFCNKSAIFSLSFFTFSLCNFLHHAAESSPLSTDMISAFNLY